MAAVTYNYFYKLVNVTEFLGLGAISFIGIADKATIFKYPKDPDDKEALACELLKLKSSRPLDVTTT